MSVATPPSEVNYRFAGGCYQLSFDKSGAANSNEAGAELPQLGNSDGGKNRHLIDDLIGRLQPARIIRWVGKVFDASHLL